MTIKKSYSHQNKEDCKKKKLQAKLQPNKNKKVVRVLNIPGEIPGTISLSTIPLVIFSLPIFAATTNSSKTTKHY
ncbi:hypothetical protein PRUPE_4G082100 [Prunus persica]|uniref:Uncharacterized protein n=1 Tax=Prunus persica TaxID=3760 RepID=M5WJS0_PRUPE|nr:hypothetical protein PRUPE_4G082100 [Prunus persica]